MNHVAFDLVSHAIWINDEPTIMRHDDALNSHNSAGSLYLHFGNTGNDWESYPILTFSEVPDIEMVLINHLDQPALGAGEPATVTTAAAIANAVFDATGIRLRQIPFTPERVRAALDSSLK